MESNQSNTQFGIFKFSFWKINGRLRVVRITNSRDARIRPRGKIVTSYSNPDLIQMLNTVRQQYGESILDVDRELLNCKRKKQYISSLIEEVLVNNGSLVTLYPLMN